MILYTVPAGHTLLRIHAGVLVRVRAFSQSDPNQLSQFQVGLGIYTAPATGFSAIYPLDHPGDVSPPMSRWLHWRMVWVTPSPSGQGGTGAYWVWHNAPQPWDIDVKAMVVANGDNLVVSMSWEPTEAIPAGWAASLSYWSSLLYS